MLNIILFFGQLLILTIIFNLIDKASSEPFKMKIFLNKDNFYFALRFTIITQIILILSQIC